MSPLDSDNVTSTHRMSPQNRMSCHHKTECHVITKQNVTTKLNVTTRLTQCHLNSQNLTTKLITIRLTIHHYITEHHHQNPITMCHKIEELNPSPHSPPTGPSHPEPSDAGLSWLGRVKSST